MSMTKRHANALWQLTALLHPGADLPPHHYAGFVKASFTPLNG
jgi:hypothetical protein